MMKFWTSLRLHTQIAVAGGLLLAVTITITTWFNIQSQREALLNNLNSESKSLARSISISSSYLVLTNKLDELESSLLQSVTFPSVISVRVISQDGRTLSHVKKLPSGSTTVIYKQEEQTLPEDLHQVKSILDIENKRLTVWQPIMTSTLLGWIKLNISLDDVIALQNQTIVENIIGAAIAIVLDILFLLVILYGPAKSFKKIVDFASRMTDSPGQKMQTEGASYELKLLVAALNNSSGELLKRDEKIKQQAENLIELNKQQIFLEKESEQKEILNSMLESVITINEDGEILSFNKAAESLFGYSEKEILGSNVNILMPSPVSEEHNIYLKRYLKDGIARVIGKKREVIARRKNNETFPMGISVMELPRNIDGKRRFIGSCQDVTQLKEKEEQLRRTQKMDALGKLTGGIAHDYNNLMGIIHGYAELMQEELKGESPLKTYINEVLNATQRGKKLTEKLLGFSRTKAANKAVYNLNDLLDEQQFMLEKTLSARIKVTFELAENIWLVELDRSEFENAIINMAINSMHAMQKGGELKFKTANQTIKETEGLALGINPGDYVVLWIMDTGEGISEEVRDRIFDPFFSTKGDLGSGLGLSQVYGFMSSCHGGVKVESRPGSGACFMLYFPKSTQQQRHDKKLDKHVPDRISHTAAILVVDDEAPLIRLADSILTKNGFTVFTANDAEQALKVLHEQKIDLLLTDVIMPGMDGYELAQKAQQIYPEIKVQIVTGYTDDRNMDTVDPVLHKNKLQKPYTANELLTSIRKLMGTAEQNNSLNGSYRKTE